MPSSCTAKVGLHYRSISLLPCSIISNSIDLFSLTVIKGKEINPNERRRSLIKRIATQDMQQSCFSNTNLNQMTIILTFESMSDRSYNELRRVLTSSATLSSSSSPTSSSIVLFDRTASRSNVPRDVSPSDPSSVLITVLSSF